MTTAFEDNLDLEKYLEHMHGKIKLAKEIVDRAKPNSIPTKLTRKLEFLESAVGNLKILAKQKESW